MNAKQWTLALALACCSGSAGAQLLNPGFESWTTDSNSLQATPDAWNLGYHYCQKVSPAQQGAHALRISVYYYYAKAVAVQKAPVTTRPAVLEGYYTYTENVVRNLTLNDTLRDTAYAYVFATKWNPAAGRADTVGYGALPLPEAGSYRRFSCPVTYSGGAVPDSITVLFDPSIVRRYPGGNYYMSTSANGYSSFLTLDNLSLQSPAGVGGVGGEEAINIYPNPASDAIYVRGMAGASYSLAITDAAGRTVLVREVGGAAARVPVGGLPAGMYLLVLRDGAGQVAAREMLVKQ